MIKQIKFAALFSIVMFSCHNKLDVTYDCNSFLKKDITYWFPETVNDTVIYLDSLGNEKPFKIIEKAASHVTEYAAIIGCSCLDHSIMLLANDSDTIGLDRISSYTKDSYSTSGSIAFKLNGESSIFYDDHLKDLEDIIVDSIQVDSCLVYKSDSISMNGVKKIYFAKGIGIVRFILQNGDVWTNNELSLEEENQLSSFNYQEYVCE